MPRRYMARKRVTPDVFRESPIERRTTCRVVRETVVCMSMVAFLFSVHKNPFRQPAHVGLFFAQQQDEGQ